MKEYNVILVNQDDVPDFAANKLNAWAYRGWEVLSTWTQMQTHVGPTKMDYPRPIVAFVMEREKQKKEDQ
jgi:hypothetical protein